MFPQTKYSGLTDNELLRMGPFDKPSPELVAELWRRLELKCQDDHRALVEDVWS